MYEINAKDVRNKRFVASAIKDLFDNIEAHKIIDFIISNFNVHIIMNSAVLVGFTPWHLLWLLKFP